MPNELVYVDDVKLRLWERGQSEAIRIVDECVKRADAAEIIHAHWVQDRFESYGMYLKRSFSCSHCGTVSGERMNFCGECGALMDEEGDEDG